MNSNEYFSFADAMQGQQRLCDPAIPRGTALRGRGLQNREQGVGHLAPPRFPQPIPERHLPTLVPFQKVEISKIITTTTCSTKPQSFVIFTQTA